MPKKKITYWPREMDEWIETYQTMTEGPEKELYFETYLYQPFLKLSESIVRFYGTNVNMQLDLDTFILDTLSFLVTKIYHYRRSSTSRSFSYFTLIARNHLFLNCNKGKRKGEHEQSWDAMNACDETDEPWAMTNIPMWLPSDGVSAEFINFCKENWAVQFNHVFHKFKPHKKALAQVILEILFDMDYWSEPVMKRRLHTDIRDQYQKRYGLNARQPDMCRILRLILNHHSKLRIQYDEGQDLVPQYVSYGPATF